MAAGSNGHVTEGSPEDGLDLPTRVLDFATELVTNPGSAPLATATRVEADHFEVTDAGQGQDDDADVLRLQWTADQHVVLQRGWAPFARAETTRASALLRWRLPYPVLRGTLKHPAGSARRTEMGELMGPDDAPALEAEQLHPLHLCCGPGERVCGSWLGV